MISGRHIFLFVTLTLGLPSLSPTAHAGSAQAPARPNEVRQAQAAARQIDALSQRVIDEAKVVGMAVAIVHDGKVLSEAGYGLTGADSKETVDADTAFRIASLSKTFAGTLAAMLVDEGALRWDSRIADQLPEFKLRDIHAAQTLTVLDILTHRVGLPFHTYDRDLEADQPYPLLVAKLGDAPTACAPGDCYGYQNIAFSLVGDMVFAATGNFYAYQVERRLFHPLGMYNASFGRDALEASNKWARPHVRRQGRWTPVRPKETYYRIPPAAGVNASVSDLSQWMMAQMGERSDVLSSNVLTAIHSPQVLTPGELRSGGWRNERVRDAHYGIGWRVFDYAGQPLVFHAGAVEGYRAMLGMLPKQRFGIVVLWNCESAAPSGLMATALDRMLGLPDRDWTGLNKAPQPRRR